MVFAAEIHSCAILHASGQHPCHCAERQTQTGVAFAATVLETLSCSKVSSLTKYRSRYDKRRLVKLFMHACRMRLASCWVFLWWNGGCCILTKCVCTSLFHQRVARTLQQVLSTGAQLAHHNLEVTKMSLRSTKRLANACCRASPTSCSFS